MGEFLVGHFSFTSSIFLSLIKNWSATAMWIYYWGHYSPLTDNWMVHTTLFSLGAMPSLVWCVCVCVKERKEDGGREKRVFKYWLDRWFRWSLFFPLFLLSANKSLSLLFFQARPSIPLQPYCHCLWPDMMDMLLKHHAKHIIIFLVIIHNLFS